AEVGHIDVEKYEIGGLALNQGHGATRVLRKVDRVALLGEQEVEHATAERIVVDDKDAQVRASFPPEEVLANRWAHCVPVFPHTPPPPHPTRRSLSYQFMGWQVGTPNGHDATLSITPGEPSPATWLALCVSGAAAGMAHALDVHQQHRDVGWCDSWDARRLADRARANPLQLLASLRAPARQGRAVEP